MLRLGSEGVLSDVVIRGLAPGSVTISYWILQTFSLSAMYEKTMSQMFFFFSADLYQSPPTASLASYYRKIRELIFLARTI